VQQARQKWKEQQARWDPERLVFIDETGLNTKMIRAYGRSLGSTRCLDKVPHGHWHTTTFIAALRLDGLCAPWLLDGPMNGEAFLVYLNHVLCPELRPGDGVICDNLSSHRSVAAREIIEGVGATLIHLPPYSPDLNPIEMVFSKLKAWLKKYRVRAFDALVNAVSEALKSFNAEECKNYFHHAQYATY